MADITQYCPRSGRLIKEEGTTVNEGNMLEAIYNAVVVNKNAGVVLNGSFARIRNAPVVGVKTVTSTAAELFAGASRLANRYLMAVYNDSTLIVYWGPSGVTTSTGYPLLPQDSIVFEFDPNTATAIYFIASANASVRVEEQA